MNIYHITYSPVSKTACLYFRGCNFACKGCVRRKESQDIHLKEAFAQPGTSVRFLTLMEVMRRLNKVEVQNAVFMGGEPTIDPKLPDLAKLIHKELGANNILLTNGFILPPLEHVDEACLSLKALDNCLHLDFTGKSNHKTLENFVKYYRSIKLRSESILIPGYIDCEEIEKIARFIADVNPNIPYRIDGYIPVPGASWRRPTSEEVDKAVNVARRHLTNVSCLKGSEGLQGEVVKIF
ncbi:hypothetical protein AKJ43_00315 [candidate division MSBL1 archaeon SCGC-AAA261D19]|uniref:Radical SAM core domain-containing protein n=1 Tax=candidate division MSBL1 archaeon SCGC-AAA261D19 TaxID=1698273 RepID=A0A133V8S5_9EURY|nr:hypothetical protein AKJ43_00315 [candidate division MSBL1 archaeon SCGC-AAA261D19]